jgi:hypothetical protein
MLDTRCILKIVQGNCVSENRKMSTDEEIREVYEQEIAEKTNLVVSKFGPMVLYGGLSGFSIEKHPCCDIVSSEIVPRKKKKGK